MRVLQSKNQLFLALTAIYLKIHYCVMEKGTRELLTERIKAVAFIKNYYNEHGEMPSVEEVKEARALTQEEIESILTGLQMDELVVESEEKEPSVLSGGTAAVLPIGIGSPIIGTFSRGTFTFYGSTESDTFEDAMGFFTTEINGTPMILPLAVRSIVMAYLDSYINEHYDWDTPISTPVTNEYVLGKAAELENVIKNFMDEHYPDMNLKIIFPSTFLTAERFALNNEYQGITQAINDYISGGNETSEANIVYGLLDYPYLAYEMPEGFLDSFKDNFSDYLVEDVMTDEPNFSFHLYTINPSCFGNQFSYVDFATFNEVSGTTENVGVGDATAIKQLLIKGRMNGYVYDMECWSDNLGVNSASCFFEAEVA